MVDKRFSSAAFEACGLDSDAARKLADLLADEIQKELHKMLTAKLLIIIERLNGMGHRLKLAYPPVPGEISYSDEWEDETGYHCKMRVALDTVVSTGYAHLIMADDDVLTKTF